MPTELITEDNSLVIAGVPIRGASQTNKRISALIWGDAGAGKTTLAATMPGRKLYIQFDPDGAAAVAHVPEVSVADFSQAAAAVTAQFKSVGNPLGLQSMMEHFDSFIFDSLTNITDKTLMHGIDTVKGATIERASPGAYGTRNALAIRLIKNVMALTGRHNKHVAFIAHEGAPTTDEESGKLLHISLALGGQLPSNIGIDFSEMWALYQVDQRADRRIAIRPSRKRKPMKTRMFVQSDEPEFDWKFDPEDWDAKGNPMYRMETWHNMWIKNEFKKLPLPGTNAFANLYKKLEG